jgi:hypothetical protein
MRYQRRHASWTIAQKRVRSVLFSCSGKKSMSADALYISQNLITPQKQFATPLIRGGSRPSTLMKQECKRMRERMRDGKRLTPSEKYSVNPILPKYATVNGNLSLDKRCLP